MKISKAEVERVAELSRIYLSSEESLNFQTQLSGILEYVEKLKQLNTENIEPTSHVLTINNVFRDDVKKESLLSKEALSNAPDKVNNFYRVQKIID